MIPKIVTDALGLGIGALLNLVPRPDKLTIIPVRTYAPVPLPTGEPYVAMINPETWSDRESVRYNAAQANSDAARVQQYQGTSNTDLSFSLVVDGTGASGEKRDVAEDIKNSRPSQAGTNRNTATTNWSSCGGCAFLKGC